MRTFRIVAFWAILAALMGSLIVYGKCMAHPVYDERGMMVGRTTSWEVTPCGDEEWTIDAPTLLGAEVERAWRVSAEGSRSDYTSIILLLRECLKYIEDGSVDQGVVFDTLVYRPITRDGVAQDEADRAAYEAERYRRETELNKKIKAMIKKLEGENK